MSRANHLKLPICRFPPRSGPNNMIVSDVPLTWINPSDASNGIGSPRRAPAHRCQHRQAAGVAPISRKLICVKACLAVHSENAFPREVRSYHVAFNLSRIRCLSHWARSCTHRGVFGGRQLRPFGPRKEKSGNAPRETSFPASISLVGPSERFAEALFSSRGSSFHQYSTLLPTHLFVWHHQDRADRAEKWLYQISVEIEQKFFGRDENRPSQNQRR